MTTLYSFNLSVGMTGTWQSPKGIINIQNMESNYMLDFNLQSSVKLTKPFF